MKLHSTSFSTAHAITGYGSTYIDIDTLRHTHSLFISPYASTLPLPDFLAHSNAQTLKENLLKSLGMALEERDIDILLIGSPYSVAQLYLPLTQCMQSLGKPHIGLEIMDFQSACGTYNILAADHKKVGAALWLPEQRQPF